MADGTDATPAAPAAPAADGARGRARKVGRYTLYGTIGQGGMASVHFGRLDGDAGFTRTVAIKRLRPELADDRELVTMLLDEARMSARIQHPNVVATLDVVTDGGEVFLVMEYVHGESLAELLAAARAKGKRLPVSIAAAILAGAARGLHAAHEATFEDGAPLDLVHRDLSPHNVLVDDKGQGKVLDFGVAKARGRQQVSRVDSLKGKVSYMAPEQVHGQVSRQSDVFALGAVAWEALTGERLFQGASDGEILAAVMLAKAAAPSTKNPDVPAALDAVVLTALKRLPAERYRTAKDFADALEAAVPVAPPAAVAAWLAEEASEPLAKRAQALAAPTDLAPSTPTPAPMATLTLVARPSPRRRPLLAAAALAFVFAVAFFGMRALRPAPSAATPSPVTTPPASAAAADRDRDRDPDPDRDRDRDRDPDPDRDPDRARDPAPDPAAPPARAPRRTPSPRSTAARCNPPYDVDARGHKVFKRECF